MASDEFHNDLAVAQHDDDALADYRAMRDVAHALCDDDWDDEPDEFERAMTAADEAWKEREDW